MSRRTGEMAKPTYHQFESAAVPSRTQHVRAKILHDHIERVLQKMSPKNTLSQSLTLQAALDESTTPRDGDARIPGGLLPEDVRNLSPVPPIVLSARFCQDLDRELKETMLAIADYLLPDEIHEADEEDRLLIAMKLPQQIRDRREALTRQETSLQESRARVVNLIEHINKAEPSLHSKLVDALTVLPLHLRSERAAQADVTAATIETALLKLSLLRARAYRALYGHTAPTKPQYTVSDAIAVAYEKLREREAAQEAEMRELDKQLDAYEGILKLVDGRNGSFAQVVNDMARVKRETEECRKDLRRLGWTGD